MERGLDEQKTEHGQMRCLLMGTEQSSSIRLQHDCIASEAFTGIASLKREKSCQNFKFNPYDINDYLSHIHKLHNCTRNQRHGSKPQLKPTYSLSS